MSDENPDDPLSGFELDMARHDADTYMRVAAKISERLGLSDPDREERATESEIRAALQDLAKVDPEVREMLGRLALHEWSRRPPTSET